MKNEERFRKKLMIARKRGVGARIDGEEVIYVLDLLEDARLRDSETIELTPDPEPDTE